MISCGYPHSSLVTERRGRNWDLSPEHTLLCLTSQHDVLFIIYVKQGGGEHKKIATLDSHMQILVPISPIPQIGAWVLLLPWPYSHVHLDQEHPSQEVPTAGRTQPFSIWILCKSSSMLNLYLQQPPPAAFGDKARLDQETGTLPSRVGDAGRKCHHLSASPQPGE